VKSAKTLLFISIIIVAFLLRFIGLGSNPPSLTWDETAWGYNAYALSVDSRDEFGRLLPFDYFESFGDFKPPVYAYLTVLPVIIFGLTEFATRFPSALFGTLSVIVTYFLVKQLFPRSAKKEILALMTAGILAISPWHIMLSRAAFEANVASFFVLAGVCAFLIAVRGNRWWLLASAASFVLSMYTFNSARIVAPLLVIILALGFHKELLQRKKEVLMSAAFGLLLLLPTLGFLFSPQASLRFREVNIFSDPRIIETANQQIANDHNAWWSKIIHNRRVGYALSYIGHYTDNLRFDFLFVKGDGNIKFSTHDTGQMYLWEFPFFIAGILYLLKKREGEWWLIFLWILIAILPAGVARETPHALRIENTLPMFQLLTAFGLLQAGMFIEKYRRGRVLYFAGLSAVIVFFFMFFMNGYVNHYTRESSREWQYGYKEAIQYATSHESEFDEIRMTTELGRPYIYVLFYTKIDPREFRQTAVVQRDAFGFVKVPRVGKYIFGGDDISSVPTDAKRVLVIDIPERVPKNITATKTFYYLNGEPSLEAYSYNR
jgi:4-amino-4-deoxy-L-arabinose transferase-like glycosyltransferase